MDTECSQKSFAFQGLHGRDVTARFDGGLMTSDAGGLLLREVERHTGILEQFADCFVDRRAPGRVEHPVRDLVAQRVYGLALGYEDLNDHDDLRRDPLLGVLVGKAAPGGEGRKRQRDEGSALAGKSTLNRLELTLSQVPVEERYKKISIVPEQVERLFTRLFIQAHRRAPQRVVLDLDATDDPVHGQQEGRFFHGYYGHYCYLPLYIFAGEHLLCAKLRPSNIDASKGAKEELERIVGQIREAWPRVRIAIRGDSGFCREEIMAWCESRGVDYVLGLARNARLEKAVGGELERARRLAKQAGKAARIYKELVYRTQKSWTRARRVVAKAEHIEGKANPRFVVTSISREEMDARQVYEEEYCARGEMENRIKEQQLYLFADRTSAATMRANQTRLWLSSVAYVLLHALRRLGLKGTSLARAQCHTIRLKILKLGAQIRLTVRRVWVSLAGGYPYAEIFTQVHENLRRLAPLRC